MTKAVHFLKILRHCKTQLTDKFNDHLFLHKLSSHCISSEHLIITEASLCEVGMAYCGTASHDQDSVKTL